MSKEIKKTAAGKKPAKASKPAAAKSAAAKPAPVTAVKKPRAVKKASAAAPVGEVAPKATAAKTSKQVTKIVVQADVGFGNQLFVRGEGPGLSWTHGVPMQCKDSNQWEWSANGVKSSFLFKVLVNDFNWSHGDNDEVAPGETKVIYPEF